MLSGCVGRGSGGPKKARLELNLVRDAKNNKKGFYMYANQKRNVKEK